MILILSVLLPLVQLGTLPVCEELFFVRVWTCLAVLTLSLIHILEHPQTGLGHPEALRGGGDITWSRHITAQDRIIYDIYEEVVEVYILEVEGHYNDK